MAKNGKKYEITIDGLTVDFYKALTGTNDFNEHFCNSFSNLVYIITRPADSEHMKEVHAQTENELYCRAYNYMRRAQGFDSRTGCTFAQALLDKVITYRQAA